MLRRLRRAAGLTQEQIAERCGVTDRTIRCLESGAVKNPHRATLDRLALALGLGGRERAAFVALWREPSSRFSPVSLIGSVSETAALLGSAVFERLMRQGTMVEDLALFKTVLVGEHRGISSERLYRSFRVLAPIDRWLFVNSFDPTATGPPEVTAVDNCRPSACWRLAQNVQMYEFCFDAELQPGDRYTFGFTLGHVEGRSGANGMAQNAETDSVLAIRSLGPLLHVQVGFHPGARPARAWHVEHRRLDDDVVRGDELRLSPFHVADLVLDQPRPGLQGVAWEWADG